MSDDPEEPESGTDGTSGGAADGQHGGQFPRHTGPPPEEIPEFDADPELEELLDRDVLELEEDVRQEVQLYRARKMKAARDAGMGTADVETGTGTDEASEEAAADEAEADEAAADETDEDETDEKAAPPPDEPGRYRGERRIGDLVESRSDGREVTRRGFISTFGLGMAGMVAAFSAGGIGSLRYFFPNVLSNPPEQFVAGEPADYSPGTVSTKYKGKFRVWIVNLSDRIVAIQAICTHLGCTPNWLDSQGIFKCPCHGSAYYMNGVNFAGPAPRPMARVGVRLNPQGKIIVDKGLVFTSNASPGWEAQDAYIKV